MMSSAARFAVAFAFAMSPAGALAASRAAMPPLDATKVIDVDTGFVVIPMESAVADGARGDAAVECTSKERRSAPDPEIRGPEDNLDPHVARWLGEPPRWWDFIGISEPYERLGEASPPMPWGGDDAVGTEPMSANGTSKRDVDARIATCFGPAPVADRCEYGRELGSPPSLEQLGLIGIGFDRPAARRPRANAKADPWVTLGPMWIQANVPRRLVAAGVRAALDAFESCYQRARIDDPNLAGEIDVVLHVRGGDTSVELEERGGIGRSDALRCCIHAVQSVASSDLPKGTWATARYSLLLSSEAYRSRTRRPPSSPYRP